MSGPLLSIVIPTKNRAVYAVQCLRTIARLPDPDLEVIVQDNSDTDDLGRKVADAGDARVRYEHRGGVLSVIENCELGMARARGTYVTLLGDDDGVTSVLPRVTAWAAAEDLDAVTPALIARYVWPDVRFEHYGAVFAGMLTVRPYSGRIRAQNAAQGVHRSLRAALQDLPEGMTLPKLYYGIVHRRCLESLKREAGSYFPGVSPDMSVAMGVSKYVRRFVSLDHPVFLPGSSAPSTAGASARKRHIGRLEDQVHLPRDCARTWPIEVPAIFSVQTVWAQSGLAALRATGRDGLTRELDLGLLHGMCGVLNRGHWAPVLSNYRRAIAATGGSSLRGLLSLGWGVARAWALRGRFLLGRVTRHPWYVGEHIRSGVPDIHDAVLALEQWTGAKRIEPALDSRPAFSETAPASH